MNIYFLIMFGGSFLAAISQVLLKKSANSSHKNIVNEYLNPRVIVGYILLMTSLLVNVYAYRGVPYKFAPVFAAATYVFSLFFSLIFLKEKIQGKIVGNIIIILGMIIYFI
ncbi:small multidrug resistance pump [Aequitasia blattaphilus]|uniref:Multidrug ABC transporter n=1 Tax=Aequitasia blattaphilus TaxID=2949332 RepID=A0ABT1E5Z1_9FIRM|nr:multidrug ABC transporter [Aequitasia blattaphilus]MCP1101251.1 multidrug ABC transporter [Aequitasia blattaphilus]MCR8613891.1 multidrug ABC transporter [Aequitasia blattaphilus]